MIFFDIIEFKKHLKLNYRVMGLDIGRVRIGCAVSDEQKSLSSGYSMFNLKKQKFNSLLIEEIINKEKIHGIVVGYPLQMDGERGDSCQMVDKFIQKYLSKIAHPIFMQDERLSSSAVNRVFREMELNRKQQSNLCDKASASYILQIVLDKLQYHDK